MLEKHDYIELFLYTICERNTKFILFEELLKLTKG